MLSAAVDPREAHRKEEHQVHSVNAPCGDYSANKVLLLRSTGTGAGTEVPVVDTQLDTLAK